MSVASRPGRYCPCSIDWTRAGKIWAKGGRPKSVRDRSRVRGLRRIRLGLDSEAEGKDEEKHSLVLLADIVDGNVLHRVLIHLLREVDRDPEEVGYTPRSGLDGKGTEGDPRPVCAASISSSRLWNHPNDPVSRQDQINSTRLSLPNLPAFWAYQICLRILANGCTRVSVYV